MSVRFGDKTSTQRSVHFGEETVVNAETPVVASADRETKEEDELSDIEAEYYSGLNIL